MYLSKIPLTIKDVAVVRGFGEIGKQTPHFFGVQSAGETNADPRSKHALACFLLRVLKALNVSLVPPESIQPDELATLAFTQTSNQAVHAGIPANLSIHIQISINGTEVLKTQAM